MLARANLEPRFWPYAFRHYLHLYNITPHFSHDASPYTICSGELPDLSLLRTFGCHVYVLPPRATRRDKLCSDTRTGIFLGYSQTMKNILYYDTTSHQIKTALHVVFDEAMNDSDIKTPNARLLCGDTILPSEVIDLTSNLARLDVSLSPFTAFTTLAILFDPLDPNPFGISVQSCSHLRCTYITSFFHAPLGCSLRSTQCSFIGSYVISISNFPVFHVNDLDLILQHLKLQDDYPPSTVTIVIAPE